MMMGKHRAMTREELAAAKAPFKVVSKHGHGEATITGFSAKDPLGVGGYMDILPATPTAYFEGGGWCLVADLLDHWDLADKPA
jgi:hypothetical protein